MKYEDWLESAVFHKTPNGVRFDLRFYVYPDGHGNIQHRNPEGIVQQENAPVWGLEAALEVLKDMWEVAQNHGKNA